MWPFYLSVLSILENDREKPKYFVAANTEIDFIRSIDYGHKNHEQYRVYVSWKFYVIGYIPYISEIRQVKWHEPWFFLSTFCCSLEQLTVIIWFLRLFENQRWFLCSICGWISLISRKRSEFSQFRWFSHNFHSEICDFYFIFLPHEVLINFFNSWLISGIHASHVTVRRIFILV